MPIANNVSRVLSIDYILDLLANDTIDKDVVLGSNLYVRNDKSQNSENTDLHVVNTNNKDANLNLTGIKGNIINSAGHLTIKQRDAVGNIIFTTTGSDTERVTITSSGRTLIGTSVDNGTDRLQVSGSSRLSGNVDVYGDSSNLYLRSSSSPTVYFTRFENRYDAANPFNLFVTTQPIIGIKQIFGSYPNTYLHGYYGITFTTADSGLVSAKMVLDNVGRLGINVTSPQKLLHIKSSETAVGATQLLLEGVGGGYGSGISFQSQISGGSLLEMARITVDGESSWNTTLTTQRAGLRFYTTYDGISSEKMRISANGGLGIARISDALFKLDVYGRGRFTVTDTSNVVLQIENTQTEISNILYRTKTGGNDWYVGNDNGHFTLWNGDYAMRILQSRRVLVNHNSDNGVDQLQVNGITKSTSYKVGMDSSDSSRGVISFHFSHFKTTNQYFNGIYHDNSGSVMYMSSSGAIRFELCNNTAYPFAIYSKSWNTTNSSYDYTERFRLDGSNGNIGIGIIPTTTLDVNGGTRLRAMLEMPTNTDLTFNAYYISGAGWKYRNTGYAMDMYQNVSGSFVIQMAVSGTQDSTINFAQALALTNTGGLFVKTISLTSVSGTTLSAITNTGSAAYFKNNNSGDNWIAYADGRNYWRAVDHVFANVAGSQKAIITGGGKFLLGQTNDNGIDVMQITGRVSITSDTIYSSPILTLSASAHSMGFAIDGVGTYWGASFLVDGVRLFCIDGADSGIIVGSTYVANYNGPGNGGAIFQGSVGIGTPTPNPSAVLDLGTTNKGFLPPRMTNAQRGAISSPAEGLMIYQTDGTKGWYGYNGTSWVILN